MEAHCFIFASIVSASGVLANKYLPSPMACGVYPMVSSRISIISDYMFKSLIYQGLILCGGLESCICMQRSKSPIPFSEGMSFPQGS